MLPVTVSTRQAPEFIAMKPRLFKQGLIATAAVFVMSAAGAESPQGSYEALFQSAISAITWDFQEDWAFTATSSGKEGNRVGRFDPRRRRWASR